MLIFLDLLFFRAREEQMQMIQLMKTVEENIKK